MRIHTQGKKKYDIYSLLIFVIVALLVLFFALVKHDEKKANNLRQDIAQSQETLSINNKIFKLYRADTSYKRTLGLSIFNSFNDDEAMLFVFDNLGYHAMWMKNMKFPIDILWLDTEKKIIDIKKYAQPYDYPETYIPKEKALYVVELKAGSIDNHAMVIGDVVYFD